MRGAGRGARARAQAARDKSRASHKSVPRPRRAAPARNPLVNITK